MSNVNPRLEPPADPTEPRDDEVKYIYTNSIPFWRSVGAGIYILLCWLGVGIGFAFFFWGWNNFPKFW